MFLKYGSGNQYHILDKAGKCWIRLDFLKNDLIEQMSSDFDSLFDLHPSERSSVLVYNKDEVAPEWQKTQCSRWYDTYLQTPAFNNTIKKSYMFAGQKDIKPHVLQKDLLEPFKVYFEELKKVTDEPYNQIVVNWYEKENDFIPMHSDWVDGLVPNSSISILNFADRKAKKVWNFVLEPRNIEHDNPPLHNKVIIPLEPGLIITMGGETQNYFRHGVPKLSEESTLNKRISFTVRNYLDYDRSD